MLIYLFCNLISYISICNISHIECIKQKRHIASLCFHFSLLIWFLSWPMPGVLKIEGGLGSSYPHDHDASCLLSPEFCWWHLHFKLADPALGSTSGFKPFDHKFMRAYVRCAGSGSQHCFPGNLLLDLMIHCTWMILDVHLIIWGLNCLHVFFPVPSSDIWYKYVHVCSWMHVISVYIFCSFHLRLDNGPFPRKIQAPHR